MQARIPTWVNGKACAGLPLDSRAFHYGDGLFETVLLLGNKPILLEQHLDRLVRDCQRMAINLDVEILEKELGDFLNNHSAAIVPVAEPESTPLRILKIMVARASSGRGYRPAKSAGADRILQLHPMSPYPRCYQEGVRASLSSFRLSDQPDLAGIKHLNRLEQVCAAAIWRSNFFQESFLLCRNSYLVEGLFSNIFMVKNDRLYTPLLDRCGVRGVMRDYLMHELAPELSLTVVEKNIGLDELLGANEVFLCNSVYVVWPLLALDVCLFERGPLTQKIQDQVNLLGYSAIYLQS